MSARRPLQSITHIVIHCSASPNGRNVTAREIDLWHGPGRKSQGKTMFSRRADIAADHEPHLMHIGYHIVNRVDGVVEYGRSYSETGAHCREQGLNKKSIGICMIGFDQFSVPQWDNLKTQVRTLSMQFADLVVIGHRDVSSRKYCPGFSVADWGKHNYKPKPEDIWRKK